MAGSYLLPPPASKSSPQMEAQDFNTTTMSEPALAESSTNIHSLRLTLSQRIPSTLQKRGPMRSANGIRKISTLSGRTIVTQYYDLIVPVNVATHTLKLFYHIMMKYAHQKIVAQEPPRPALTVEYGLLAVSWSSFGGEGGVPWEAVYAVAERLLELMTRGFSGLFSAHAMRNGVVISRIEIRAISPPLPA